MKRSVFTEKKRFINAFIAGLLCLFLASENLIAAPAFEKFSTPEIPAVLGKVEETFQGKPSKTIYFVQDAHTSLEAQENIAKLVSYFVSKKKVRTVFEEGYSGPVPTDVYFGFIPDAKVREKVAYFFMDKLRLGGAEYAHITRKNDFNLIGVDDADLHRKNIAAYRRHAAHQKNIRRELDLLLAEIQKLSHASFSKELKDWIKIRERYQHGKLSLLDYLKRLTNFKTGKEAAAGILGANTPALSLVLEAEKSQDPEQLEKLKALDARQLFQEIEFAEEAFAAPYLKEERVRKLFGYYRTLNLLKRLSEVEVTTAEYEAARISLKAFSTQELAGFMAQASGKPILLSKRWEKRILSAAAFYELAHARNKAVAKNLDVFLESAEESAVLVFGGFHAAEIKRSLKERGISYAVISPRITREDKIHEGYYKQLMASGYHAFEVPFNVRTAAKVQPVFSLAGARREIRAVYKAVHELKETPANWIHQVEQKVRPENRNEAALLEGKRFVIVGAGPSGLGAAVRLLKANPNVQIDILDEIPRPFGLINYGVRNDKEAVLKEKLIKKYSAEIFGNPNVRFIGNVKVGRDLSIHELQDRYDGVVVATGAQSTGRLNIPGEDHVGIPVYAGKNYVFHYNARPPQSLETFNIGETVVIIGNGNISADVAHQILKRTKAKAVIILGRRGPAQSSFSLKELKDVSGIENLRVVIDENDFNPLDEAEYIRFLEEKKAAADAELKQKMTVLDELKKDDPLHVKKAQAEVAAAEDRKQKIVTALKRAYENPAFLREQAKASEGARGKILMFKFLVSPTEIVIDNKMRGLQIAHNDLVLKGGDYKASMTSAVEFLPANTILYTIGDLGVAVPGLPFDEKNGRVPTKDHQVIDPVTGKEIPGIFAAGWFKTGARGLIANAMQDGEETAEAMFGGLMEGPSTKDPQDLAELLQNRGVDIVTFEDYSNLYTFETRVKQAKREAFIREALAGKHGEKLQADKKLRDKEAGEIFHRVRSIPGMMRVIQKARARNEMRNPFSWPLTWVRGIRTRSQLQDGTAEYLAPGAFTHVFTHPRMPGWVILAKRGLKSMTRRFSVQVPQNSAAEEWAMYQELSRAGLTIPTYPAGSIEIGKIKIKPTHIRADETFHQDVQYAPKDILQLFLQERGMAINQFFKSSREDLANSRVRDQLRFFIYGMWRKGYIDLDIGYRNYLLRLDSKGQPLKKEGAYQIAIHDFGSVFHLKGTGKDIERFLLRIPPGADIPNGLLLINALNKPREKKAHFANVLFPGIDFEPAFKVIEGAEAARSQKQGKEAKFAYMSHIQANMPVIRAVLQGVAEKISGIRTEMRTIETVQQEPVSTPTALRGVEEDKALRYFLQAFGVDAEKSKIEPLDGPWGKVTLGEYPPLGLTQEEFQPAFRESIAEIFAAPIQEFDFYAKAIQDNDPKALSEIYLLTYDGIPTVLIWPAPPNNEFLVPQVYYPLFSSYHVGIKPSFESLKLRESNLEAEVSRFRTFNDSTAARKVYYPYNALIGMRGLRGDKLGFRETEHGMSFPGTFITNHPSSLMLRGTLKALRDSETINFQGLPIVEVGGGSGDVALDMAEWGADVSVYDITLLKALNPFANAARRGLLGRIRPYYSRAVKNLPPAKLYVWNVPDLAREAVRMGAKEILSFERTTELNTDINPYEFAHVLAEIRHHAPDASILLRLTLSREKSFFENVIKKLGLKAEPLLLPKTEHFWGEIILLRPELRMPQEFGIDAEVKTLKTAQGSSQSMFIPASKAGLIRVGEIYVQLHKTEAGPWAWMRWLPDVQEWKTVGEVTKVNAPTLTMKQGLSVRVQRWQGEMPYLAVESTSAERGVELEILNKPKVVLSQPAPAPVPVEKTAVPADFKMRPLPPQVPPAMPNLRRNTRTAVPVRIPSEQDTDTTAFGARNDSLDAVPRNLQWIREELNLKVPVFEITDSLEVKLNPAYFNPLYQAQPGHLSKPLQAVAKAVQAVLKQQIEEPLRKQLLENAALRRQYESYLDHQAVAHFIYIMQHVLYEAQWDKLRPTVKTFLEDRRAIDDHKAPAAIFKRYASAARTQRLHGKPALLHLMTPNLVVAEGDSRANDPEAMVIEKIMYQPGRGRGIPDQLRREEMDAAETVMVPGSQVRRKMNVVRYPPEKILFARWKGRPFMFYISRSHTPAEGIVRSWRQAEGFLQSHHWIIKGTPENIDDLPVELAIRLDEILLSRELELKAGDYKTSGFLRRLEELGFLNFVFAEELEKVYAARNQAELDDLQRQWENSLNHAPWLKENAQIKAAVAAKTQEFKRVEVRVIEKLNALTTSQIRERLKEAYETGDLKWQSHFEDWNKQEGGKVLAAGFFVLRKIQGQWSILVARKNGKKSRFFVLPSGKVDHYENSFYENEAGGKELIAQKLALESDFKKGRESTLAGGLRELWEEAGIRGKIHGRLSDYWEPANRKLVNYFIFVDGETSRKVRPPDTEDKAELKDFRWVPAGLILSAEDGAEGKAVRKYVNGDIPRVYEHILLRQFKQILMRVAEPPAKEQFEAKPFAFQPVQMEDGPDAVGYLLDKALLDLRAPLNGALSRIPRPSIAPPEDDGERWKQGFAKEDTTRGPISFEVVEGIRERFEHAKSLYLQILGLRGEGDQSVRAYRYMIDRTEQQIMRLEKYQSGRVEMRENDPPAPSANKAAWTENRRPDFTIKPEEIILYHKRAGESLDRSGPHSIWQHLPWESKNAELITAASTEEQGIIVFTTNHSLRNYLTETGIRVQLHPQNGSRLSVGHYRAASWTELMKLLEDLEMGPEVIDYAAQGYQKAIQEEVEDRQLVLRDLENPEFKRAIFESVFARPDLAEKKLEIKDLQHFGEGGFKRVYRVRVRLEGERQDFVFVVKAVKPDVEKSDSGFVYDKNYLDEVYKVQTQLRRQSIFLYPPSTPYFVSQSPEGGVRYLSAEALVPASHATMTEVHRDRAVLAAYMTLYRISGGKNFVYDPKRPNVLFRRTDRNHFQATMIDLDNVFLGTASSSGAVVQMLDFGFSPNDIIWAVIQTLGSKEGMSFLQSASFVLKTYGFSEFIEAVKRFSKSTNRSDNLPALPISQTILITLNDLIMEIPAQTTLHDLLEDYSVLFSTAAIFRNGDPLTPSKSFVTPKTAHELYDFRLTEGDAVTFLPRLQTEGSVPAHSERKRQQQAIRTRELVSHSSKSEAFSREIEDFSDWIMHNTTSEGFALRIFARQIEAVQTLLSDPHAKITPEAHMARLSLPVKKLEFKNAGIRSAALEKFETLKISAARLENRREERIAAPLLRAEYRLSSFENKRVFVSGKDLENFSDAQIKELAYIADRPGSRDFRVVIYNLDPTTPLGQFFRSQKLKNLRTFSGDFSEAAAEHAQHFNGDVIHLSSAMSGVEAAVLKHQLEEAGIPQDYVYPLSYGDTASGTLGVGLQDLQEGRLKKQLPDYMAYDNRGRIYLTDSSIAGRWRDIYEGALAFARAA